MTTTTRRHQGRPALAWLSADATATLPLGTAVSVETRGRHAPRTAGRILGAIAGTIELATFHGEVTIPVSAIKRARILPSLYEPGDPVLRRDVPAADWRGGVVRTDGTSVLVEQIDGTFAWFPEDDLEPADARDAPLAPPVLPRGPVPA
jgi:hypothetical protein